MTLSPGNILTLKGIILNIVLINWFGKGGLFRPQYFNMGPLELCFFISPLKYIHSFLITQTIVPATTLNVMLEVSSDYHLN